MSDAATWDRQLTAAEVSSLYATGTTPAPLLTKVTRPSGKVFEQASYSAVTAQVTGVTDASGGSWTVGAPADSGSSRKYVAAVLGGQPSDYWRLADIGTTTAVNQVKGGTATYSNVTQGLTGGPFSDAWVDGFNGSSSYLALPNGLIGAGNQSVSLWFNTTATDGVLLSSSAAPAAGTSTTTAFTPNLYVGQDGHLNGEFVYGNAPIASGARVNDGKWHNVVLAAGTSDQELYLDGQLVGKVSGTITGGSAGGQGYDYIGTGFLGHLWPDQPHYSSSDPAGYTSYFNGDIAEVAFYPGQMSADEAAGQWDAAQHSAGLSPVETTLVTDPGGRTLSYVYDPLNSGRMLSQTDGLGDVTTYGYDSLGFQDQVTDPNGDVTDSGHDVRGNVVSTVTCQDQAAAKCSTSYASYSPDDQLAELQQPYSGNDLMQSFRDARSSSATDNTYLTTSTYDSSTGELLTQTTPPVPGWPSGRTTHYSYTDGTTTAGGANGSVPPAGLLWKTVSPAGAVTQTLYNANGDVGKTISPLNLQTSYRYDGIGRKIWQQVVSDTYTLTTTYAYDAEGRLTLQTDPAVTDRVTGATHTKQVSSTYDADGNLTSQQTADTTGGDTSRTESATYNAFDQKATSTDAAGAVTQYAYDSYGNLASQTDPAGNLTQYAYDPNGHLLTTTLANYTGSPPGSQAAAPLIEESRAYDPAGRLASVTDAMGRVTSYAYTDDGLTASVTRTGPGGGSYTEEADTYDPAGNLITKVTDNGATTTNYAVDAASRVASQALDPAGLNRVTAYTYTPDDHVATQAVSAGSGPALQTTSYTYDLMGDTTSQTVSDPGAEGPAGWWPLNETSGTTAYDVSASSNVATASGVTWTGDGARFTGQAGQVIATRGPMVDTTGSFTVSAWVNLAAVTGNGQDVVSQDASAEAGFYIGIESGSSSWEFGRALEDENNAPDWAVAGTGAAAQAGSWTLLTGVFNVNTGAMQLYVNGTDNGGDATDTSPIASAGPLEMGADKSNGHPGVHNFDGTISNVEVYPFALSAGEVSSLYSNGGDITRGSLTTSYQVDQLGQVTAQTSPDGTVTSFAYDAAGQRALVTGPPVAAQVSGGTPVGARPIATTGYNTFGEVTETQDPNGNVTTSVYDADGRPVSQALPPYTPPGGTGPVSGTTVTAYNTLGQVTASTDPLGNVTRYAYDQLGHRTGQTDPNNGVTTASYDADGEALSVTGPTGAQATSTYDYLGRQVTATSVERYPSAASYTTTTSYAPTPADPSGTWKSLVTSPDGVTTGYGYDAAGETTQVTDGAGNLTKYSFDALGRQTATTNPDGTSDTVTYDQAGNQLGQASLDAAGNILASTSATYNGEGQQLSTIDALGYCTAYTYDPTGSLTAETQPVTSSLGIITSFGYDLAGNQTRYTDGNGHPWITTYNSWNLPQTQVEPSTSTYTTTANSTTTVAYNGDQQPVTVTEPGGVTVSDTYNSMGDLTGQSGTGASAPTATRSFTYDTAGRMLTAATTSSAGSGQPSNATSETFSYDDRGLLTAASGSAGSTSYTYNGDGQQASVQDGAGTASYGYDSAGRLHTMGDPASGATLTYAYNPMSQVSQVAYGGTGADTRAFGYDSLHRLTSDTLTHGSTTLAAVSYGYDLNGDLTSKTTTGFAGASANTYAYDRAGRLTSWTSGSTTTSYAYDGAGNRTQAGTVSYTYDARDQLTSDGTSTYAYTANGDLASVTGPSGTTASTSDAYGQQGAQGTQGNTYDALGRDTQLTAGSVTTALAYEGTTGQLAGDGASSYTYTPGGTLTGTAPATVPGTGVLDFTDHHTDLAAQFTATGTTLTGSRTYGPWGATLATGGALTGALGYQSQYTSPATGQVNMGARWYNPATGSFGNKDTVSNKPVPDSASASPFGYAADNPLGLTDPTGHRPIPDGSTSDPGYAKALKTFATKSLPAQLAAIKAAAAARIKAQQQAAAKKKQQLAAQRAAETAAGCLFLTSAGCAGQLRAHSVLDATPAQRATDNSAYQQVTADAKRAAATAISHPRTQPGKSSSTQPPDPCLKLGIGCICTADPTACYNNNWNTNKDPFTSLTTTPGVTSGPECSKVLSTGLGLICPPTINAAASGEEPGPRNGGNGSSAGSNAPGVPNPTELADILAKLRDTAAFRNGKTLGQAINVAADGSVTPLGKPIPSGANPATDDIVNYLSSQGVELDSQGRFAAAEHPDTIFAWLERESKSNVKDASILITNDNGPCEGLYSCQTAIPQILRQDQSLTVYYPGGPNGEVIPWEPAFRGQG
jgi:RHS repeat-associated protein